MKKQKSLMRKIMISILSVFVAIVIIFFIGRYGWKLAGFSACEGAGIEKVEVVENGVRLKGFNPSSFPTGFLGYHAKEIDGELYVGFKFSFIFGIFERGDFDIVIPTKNEISKVVIKTNYEEYEIWPEREKKANRSSSIETATCEELPCEE